MLRLSCHNVTKGGFPSVHTVFGEMSFNPDHIVSLEGIKTNYDEGYTNFEGTLFITSVGTTYFTPVLFKTFEAELACVRFHDRNPQPAQVSFN